MECENPKHKGHPKEKHGEGYWWLKDPEWEYWCPECAIGNFRECMKKVMAKPKEV